MNWRRERRVSLQLSDDDDDDVVVIKPVFKSYIAPHIKPTFLRSK